MKKALLTLMAILSMACKDVPKEAEQLDHQQIEEVYSLKEFSTIDAKNSDATAYYLFDTHYTMRGQRSSDPKALDCQVAVYRKVEQLHSDGLRMVFVEGTYKGVSQLDKIKEQVKNYTRSVPAQYEGTATLFDDDVLVAFIYDTEDQKNVLAINYAGTLSVVGWERTPDEELGKEHAVFFERSKRLEETYKRVQSGEIKEGSPEYQQYLANDKQFTADLESNRKRRSLDAYTVSQELGDQVYAVVIGRAHNEDIINIIASQESHPKIVGFVCP